MTIVDLVLDKLNEMYIGKKISNWDTKPFVVDKITAQETYDGFDVVFWDEEASIRSGLRTSKFVTVYASSELPEIIKE